MTSTIILCLILLSLANSSLLDQLDGKSVSNNEAACNDLKTQAVCVKAGPCVWGSGNPGCTLDPCFERSLTTTSACPSVTDGSTCSRVPKAGGSGPSHFCVNTTRLGSFTTPDQICSLEWGGWRLVELAACKTLSTQAYGCGPVEKLEGDDENHYVCKAGTPPESPCHKISTEELCKYVGDCLWDDTPAGESVVGCVGDECWEKTYTSADGCKTNIEGVTCTKHILNNGGTPEYGYCKTGTHDLHSECNVGTATNIVSKQTVCTWAGTKIPADCNKVATIDNYDDGTLYVCNPTGEEFDVNGANSLKSLAVGLFTAILLIAML